MTSLTGGASRLELYEQFNDLLENQKLENRVIKLLNEDKPKSEQKRLIRQPYKTKEEKSRTPAQIASAERLAAYNQVNKPKKNILKTIVDPKTKKEVSKYVTQATAARIDNAKQRKDALREYEKHLNFNLRGAERAEFLALYREKQHSEVSRRKAVNRLEKESSEPILIEEKEVLDDQGKPLIGFTKYELKKYNEELVYGRDDAIKLLLKRKANREARLKAIRSAKDGSEAPPRTRVTTASLFRGRDSYQKAEI